LKTVNLNKKKRNTTRSKKLLLEEINEARRLCGLPELNIKRRSCLKCDRKFKSEGNHNRICKSCTDENRYSYCQFPEEAPNTRELPHLRLKTLPKGAN